MNHYARIYKFFKRVANFVIQAIAFVAFSLYPSSCNETDIYDPDHILNCNATELQDSRYNIILIMGQSNTHSGLGLNPDLDTVSAGIMQLGRFEENNLKVIKAKAPLDHHTSQPDRIGFGLTFANLFKSQLLTTEDSIIIIPCGFGSTGFSDDKWNKGDILYNDAVDRTKLILDMYPTGKLQAILWHQGEKDVNTKDYEYLLNTFIKDLRNDLDNPEVPFILGGMVPYWVNKNQRRVNLQKTIARVPLVICNTAYADPTKPYIIEKADKNFEENHFDAKGQREMGKRYFQAYMNIILKEKP